MRHGEGKKVLRWSRFGTRLFGLRINQHGVYGYCVRQSSYLQTEAFAVDGKCQVALKRIGNIVCDGVEVDGFLSGVAVRRRCTAAAARAVGVSIAGRRVHATRHAG